MASIEPELWVDGASRAVAFYVRAFEAKILHKVGTNDDIVAQLGVSGAAFWVASADAAPAAVASADVVSGGTEPKRFGPNAIGGATSRTLLVVDDPEAFQRRAIDAGATELSPVADEHGWRLGRIRDPFGHEWEIGRPVGTWPPA